MKSAPPFFSRDNENKSYHGLLSNAMLGLAKKLHLLIVFCTVAVCQAQHPPVSSMPIITRIPTPPPEAEGAAEAVLQDAKEPQTESAADEYQRLLEKYRTVTVSRSGEPKAATERGAATELGQNILYDQKNLNRINLQRANQSLVGFPLDRLGKVDWVQAIQRGLIAPRANKESGGEMEVLDLDVILTNTKAMPYVRFPHFQHTQWLHCSNCHDDIFKPVAGSTKIIMEDIFKGKYCGVCHDRVAFSTYACERCHSVEQATYNNSVAP